MGWIIILFKNYIIWKCYNNLTNFLAYYFIRVVIIKCLLCERKMEKVKIKNDGYIIWCDGRVVKWVIYIFFI